MSFEKLKNKTKERTIIDVIAVVFIERGLFEKTIIIVIYDKKKSSSKIEG
jgi:hypothetical protein